MIKAKNGKCVIKGDISKAVFELKDIFEGGIEVFGIKGFTSILRNAKQLKGYKVTIEKLNLDKELENDLFRIIKNNQN